MAARLKEKYTQEIAPALSKEFGYSNPMSIPKIEKIVLNMGLGDAISNNKVLDIAVNELTAIARRPLGMGLLTGKFKSDSTIAENDMRRRFKWDFQTGKQAAQLKKLDAVRELLTVDERTVAQGALGYILAKRSIILPIPGFKTADHVVEHLGAMRHGPLPAAAMEELERVLTNFEQ